MSNVNYDLVYPKVCLHWGHGKSETDMDLFRISVTDALRVAETFGYKKPIWYKPWRYILNNMWIVTVGFGEKQRA